MNTAKLKSDPYQSRFARLWERYDEASHDNAEHMRDILELTLDALETAERHIFKTEREMLALRERAEPVATLYKAGNSARVIMIGADLADGYTDVFAELQTAPPAPVVPDEIIELLHAARSYVKSCAGSDGHAFGVLRAIDRACRAAMLTPPGKN
ncbi:hypothetical protein CDT97_10225 [Cronobacter sakazakii]|uniref:hypothetical protein n=1 Tax=Cronobacter sakazakii TaxID=28141 RepID=UPI000BEAAB21|nr:hypothetical protein [Cronobacter sakazakii]PQV67630.1 hypothetical protein CDT97_10225 [Cronobacter sakazakii]